MARSAIRSNQPERKANVRSDGELYARPVPNPFSDNWKDGFRSGYDGTSHYHAQGRDREWRDGYQTGMDQMIFDAEGMDREHSSNA